MWSARAVRKSPLFPASRRASSSLGRAVPWKTSHEISSTTNLAPFPYASSGLRCTRRYHQWKARYSGGNEGSHCTQIAWHSRSALQCAQPPGRTTSWRGMSTRTPSRTPGATLETIRRWYWNEKLRAKVLQQCQKCVFSTAKDRDKGEDKNESSTSSKGGKGSSVVVTYLSDDERSPMSSVSRRKRSRRFFAPDPDRKFYAKIQNIQNLKKEQARRKTASNVYRALWGNVVICAAKFGAWLSSGSSGMLAEFFHSVVDCGNQALLLMGLSSSSMSADRKHPYGYGKSVYFWALVSALGTFFLGAGVSMTHAIDDLLHPSLHEITWQVWSVLALSFAVDGYVFTKTIAEIRETQPANMGFWKHLSNIRDPATLAILLEDGAACLGVVIAFAGIAGSHATNNPIFDGIAGVSISGLLGVMGLLLARMNHRFLLGQAVDREITDEIEKVLVSRRSIDSIRSVQSQWISSETFSYKAEVDFDGTYLAAKLMPIYQQEFMQIRDTMDQELQVLLALYAEDVMRAVEREVRHVEAQIRKKYPGAEYIELEPMSMDVDRLAIDDNLESELRRVESDALNRYLKSLNKEQASADDDSKEQTAPANNNDKQ